LAVALAVSLALADPDAFALGFGEPQVSSALGQPLRMRIPLRVDRDMDITSECLRLIGATSADTLPTLSQARLTLEEHGAERSLRVDSLLPVNEPILRVTIEAGCMQRVRREFVLLLDPPESATPNIVAGSMSLPPMPRAETAGAPEASNAAGTAANSPAATPPDLGLGIAKVDGRVGQPLAMQIPLSGPGAAALDPGCIHLSNALGADGAPVLNDAKLTLGHEGGQTTINLLTPEPVTEPAMRVILEVGCGVPLRREYGVLLDNAGAPPAPSAAADAAAAATAAAAAAPSAPAPAAAPAAEAAAQAGAAPIAPSLAAPPVVAAAKPPKPAAPPKPHKSSLPAVRPTNSNSAPSAAPPASKAPAAVAAVTPKKPEASSKPATKAPASAPAPTPASAAHAPANKTPEPDHLVLTAPDDQATITAVRLAEMDKRVEELTKEVSQLRAELATERQQHQADTAAAQKTGNLGWVVAALSLLGLAVASVMAWRGRTTPPWHGGSWNEPDEGGNTRMAAAAPATALRVDTLSAPAPAARPAKVATPSVTPLPPSRPLATPTRPPRRTTTLPEVEVETEPASMEITELHNTEPSLEKLRTLFNDVNEAQANPEDEVVTGLGRLTVPLDLPLAPDVSNPGAHTQPPPPTTRSGDFTYEEPPLTQTPTLVALDLDLTTKVVGEDGNTVPGETSAGEKNPRGDGEAPKPKAS
jgi:hypothetical protein